MRSNNREKSEKSLSKRAKEFDITIKKRGVTPSGRVKWLNMDVKIYFDNGTSLLKEVEDEKELYALIEQYTKPKQIQGVLYE